MVVSDECGYDPTDTIPSSATDYTATGLINRIQKKRLDLMEQLLDHYGGRQHLSEMDLIRYSAMVEVLKAVLQ